jgi:hypothetical protein
MTGGSGPDKSGALAKVPTVLGMGSAGPGRPTYRHTWRTALGESTTGRAGLYTLVMAADPVLAFEAWRICDER